MISALPTSLLVGIPFLAGLLLFPRETAPSTPKVVIPLSLDILKAPKPVKYLEGRQPAAVAKLADKWSSVFRIPRSWIRSQAYVETENVPMATNPRTGAKGVMQIMPGTYAWLLPSLKKTTYAHNRHIKNTLQVSDTGRLEDLHDIDFNIMLASYLMTILKKKFGENHRNVAAAYDAGHVRVEKCLNQGVAFPPQVEEYIARVEAAKRRGFM